MELTKSTKTDISSKLELDSRFKDAISFFQKRSPVVFISQHYRFWEQHGFVQQSLAKLLTDSGVPVIWFDGADWRRKKKVQNWDSPLLNVVQLPCIPLRRLSILDSINPKVQLSAVKKVLLKGHQPLLWVQGGLDERVVSGLPYIDVFSVFDDPYIHSPQGELAKKSALIVAQNEFVKNIFDKNQTDKTTVLFPPVELIPDSCLGDNEFKLPENFPKKIMGYIGSFFNSGFDLVLFDDFIRSLPDWGFILCGRTDSAGLKKIQSWSQYANFLYLPWIPRSQVGPVWKILDLNLMLYRPEPTSHGAFPVKFLEALHYGVPSVATAVPKTISLDGFIPRLVFPEQLKAQAVKEALNPNSSLELLYEKFRSEMDPKFHLIRVSEALRTKKY